MSLCIFVLFSISAQFISVLASYSCKTNEIYHNCMQQEELTCENWAHPIHLDNCIKGCSCISGYVRGENNRCILKKDCPKPPNCKRHERFYEVGYNISTCLQPTSITINEPNCYCHVGFVKDTTNDKCVRWPNCPCFKANQVYSECVPEFPKSCSHRSKNTKHYTCLSNTKGCICQDGFVLNKNEECILAKECPPTICEAKCGKHETYVTCINELRCNMTRTQTFAKCKSGCQCNSGYARDQSGRCIKLGKCECQENAEFVVGPQRCPRMCANMYNNEPPCEGIVPGGCECKPRYVLDTQGDCILEEECKNEQVICPNNMIYVTDGYGISCRDIYKTPVAKKQTGCICEDGLYHDEETSTCVVAEECSNSKQNQACRKRSDRFEYKTCQYAGCVKTCENPNVVYCTQGNCTSGCYCRNGYVQVSYTDKDCVLVDDCKCQTNATYKTCAPPIPTSCANMYQRGRVQITLCAPRCDCNEGYVLNKDNKCIQKSDCPPNEIKCNSNLILALTAHDFYECGQTEPKRCEIGCICPEGMYYDVFQNKCVFSKECTGSHDNQMCAEVDPYKEYREYMQSNCIPTCSNPIPTMCNKFNIPGCYCKNGMVQVNERNKTCVLAYDCPDLPTQLQCDNNLEAVTTGVMKFCNSTSENVVFGCVCPDKLFYDPKSNKCVQPDQCTPPVCINPLKEYKTCQSSSCVPTCENPAPTMCTRDCRNGCFCKDEFIQVSFDNETCVTLGDCPCDRHARPKKCTTPCRKTCATVHSQEKCTLCHDTPQCECIDGYVLNNKNECVLIEKCTGEDIICPPFMEYSTCHTCERSCNDLNPICTKQCHVGCSCIDGYVLNNKQVCIPEENCQSKTEKCKGPHEVFNTCKNACPETCATIYQPPRPCPRICVAGYDCIDGYIRNSKGICIKSDNCQPNEYVCPPFMNLVHKPTMFATCSGTELVNKGCVCNGALAYNKWTKTCITKAACPEYLDKECKLRDPNSQYSSCPTCPKTCQYKNRICSMACRPACECKENFILTEDGGKCILPYQCPISIPITCGEHEVYSGCKDTCPRTCANMYTGKPKFCATICVKGCDCLDGYVKRFDGVCVKPQHCPIDEIICPQNLVATEQVGELQTCESHFGPDSSSSSDGSKECSMAQCICETGFVYDNSTNTCVYPRMCPNSLQNEECRQFDKNSVYSITHDCEHSCTDKSTITKTCKEECICKFGYVRDPDWKCVPVEKCPIDCGTNATYRMFGIGCGDRCENHHFLNLIMCMPIYRPGCYCNTGYVFNHVNKCVLYEDCTPEEIQCHLHPAQQYAETNRPRTCTELHSNNILFRKGCFCPDGMVLNESTMKCVDTSECPSTCSDPDKELTCYPSSCVPTCDRNNFTSICTTDCRFGCYCKRGLVQISNHDRTCISINKCAHIGDNYCPINATLKYCTASCRKTCANAHFPCPIVCHDKPRCECNPGYALKANGDCVLYEDCQLKDYQCGKNMIYSTCHGCERTCYNMHPLCTKECKTGCFCKPGYILNYLGGECIPETDCNQTCAPNEVNKECKNHCPTTCANMQDVQKNCVKECTAGCDCDDGFVRNSAGLCVTPNECEINEGICKGNLVYSSTVQDLNTCKIYFAVVTDEPMEYVQTHCVCEYGKLYDVPRQRCVLATECPQYPSTINKGKRI